MSTPKLSKSHFEIEMYFDWTEFYVGYLSDAAVAAICAGGDCVEIITNDTGDHPDGAREFPACVFENMTGHLRYLPLGAYYLKKIKVSSGKRKIKIGKSNILIVPLECDEPYDKDYLNDMGMVSIDQLAEQIADSSVCAKIRDTYREDINMRNQLWQRSKLGGNVFIWQGESSCCYTAEGEVEGDLQSEDVKFIFFAASPILFNCDRIKDEDGDKLFPGAGLYLHAIIIRNKLVEFETEGDAADGFGLSIVTYAHDQVPRVVFSE